MSYPDKLIVSGAGSDSVNGEYLRDTTSASAQWRFGNFVILAHGDGWILRYVSAPTELSGYEDEIGYTGSTLEGQYETQPLRVIVTGAGLAGANGLWEPHPTIADHYQNPGSANWLMGGSSEGQWEITFSHSIRYYSLFTAPLPWQASPWETWNENLYGVAPAVISSADYFQAPAPFIEGVFNPTPTIPEATDLLPPNATAQERALSKATARAGSVPVLIKQVWSPQTCPAGLLPWLAWALSVDDWQTGWTEQQKRDAIAASVQIHRVKGTVGAVRRALQAIGYEVLVNENTGTPYTFRLQVDIGTTGGTEAVYNEAERIALTAKNARSHLLGVDALGRVSGVARIASAGIDGNTTRVWPEVVELLEHVTLQRALSAEHTIDTTRVSPISIDSAEFIGGPECGGAFTYDLTVTL